MAGRHPSSRRAATSPLVLGCLALVTLPLGVGGLWSSFAAATAFLDGNHGQAMGLGAFSLTLFFFALVPPLVAWAMSATRSADQDLAVRRSNHPDAPWMWREDWARGMVVHEEGVGAIVALGAFAVFWNAFVLVMVVAVGRGVRADERLFVLGIMSLFMLAGIFLGFKVVQTILKRLRFGQSAFQLDWLPATPGGQVSGVLHVPAGLERASAFEVALFGLEVFRGEDTSERVMWQDALTLPRASVDRGPEGILIPVAFEIPQDAAPTSPREQDRRRMAWRLTVKAAVTGVDYEAAFEVPVFRTDAPQRLASRGVTQERARPQAPGEMEQPATSRIRVEPTEGGTALQYPAPSWLRGWTLVPLLFVPAAAWLGRQPFLAHFPYPAVVAVGGAITLFFWGLTFLGVVFTPSRVEVLDDRVIVRRGLGRYGWGRTVHLSEVKSVVARTIGNPGQAQQSVDILTTNGGEYWAAISLRDASEAKWLAGEIERLVRTTQARRGG